MINTPIIWTLTDDRPGNRSQALGLAEALAMPFVQKEIRYNAFGRLPNLVRGASLLGVDRTKSDPLHTPWPDVIIAAGRRTVPVARFIKKQSGGKAKLVQLMWPGAPLSGIDLIITPKHDGITTAPCPLITTTGAIHRVNSQTIANALGVWESRFATLPSPRIAVLIGGTTSKGAFTLEHAGQLLQHLNAMAAESGGSLLITTSRRTPDAAIDLLKAGIAAPHYFHDWREAGENPYFGLLAHADRIVVTGDSMSMCSEAAVWSYAPLNESERVGGEVRGLVNKWLK
jgi:mitochondrial fission protein ELM1